MKKSWRLKVICTNFYHFISVLSRHKQSVLAIKALMVTFVILFTFSCGKVEKSVQTVVEEEKIALDIPYENETKFRMHMGSLEDHYDDLEIAIVEQNWENISKYAMQMKNTSPVILTGKRKDELPHDFIMMDTMFHLRTLALVEASKAREMVQLNIEYDKVKQTCDDCHERYKTKHSEL